ncbi:O-antigen ligase family protein [Parvularcula bermudensis]|nr:O-antigen ligase family protein [Parvularcula bermudensis]
MSAVSDPIDIDRPSRFAVQPGRGTLLDEAMMMAAFIILPLNMPMMQPVRAPFTLLLLAYLAFIGRPLLAAAWRHRWVYILPALAAASAIWADSASAALRHGILMTVMVTVALAAAIRLDIRQLAIAVLFSQGALALGSLMSMETMWVGGAHGAEAVVGLFPAKNVLGKRMLLVVLAAVAVMVGAGYRPVFKPIALGLSGIALFLIVQSLSASSIILLALAVPLGVGLAVVWRPATAIRGARPVIVSGVFLLLALGATFAIIGLRIDPLADLLGLFGKDATLTGRTVLWEAARQVIADHPLLGVGAGNFWAADNDQALILAKQFYKPDHQFSFHNAYFEIAVHLGAVGVLVFLGVFLRGVWTIGQTWWRTQGRADVFPVILGAVIAIRTLTEAEMFDALLLAPLLFWAVVLLSEEERGRAAATH